MCGIKSDRRRHVATKLRICGMRVVPPHTATISSISSDVKSDLILRSMGKNGSIIAEAVVRRRILAVVRVKGGVGDRQNVSTTII
jgi:hypothetical protein